MLHQEKANFWLVISLVFVLTVLYFIPVNSIDADSRTYSNITANLARRPLKELFAVKWYGDYKIYSASSVLAEYFYEHPPGLFFLPWIVAQLGFPGYNALFAVDIIFQICCFVILINLGRRFLPNAYVHLIPFMLLFMPIAFQYNVRGNHESGILFYFLLSFLVVSGECTNTWHILVLIFTFTSLVFLKGALALPCFFVVFITAMVSWRLRQGSFSCFIKSKPCFFLIISLVFSVFFAIVFEWVHFKLTGNSFWTLNLNLQVLKRAVPPARSSVWLFRKAYNVGFYLLMVSWYSFPYSIVQIYRFFTRQVSVSYIGDLVLTKKQLQEWHIIVIAILLCSGIYILGLSLSDRLAQRYIYPVYWIVGFAAAASLIMSSKRLRDLSDTWIGENSLSLLWICWGLFKVVAIVFKWL